MLGDLKISVAPPPSLGRSAMKSSGLQTRELCPGRGLAARLRRHSSRLQIASTSSCDSGARRYARYSDPELSRAYLTGFSSRRLSSPSCCLCEAKKKRGMLTLERASSVTKLSAGTQVMCSNDGPNTSFCASAAVVRSPKRNCLRRCSGPSLRPRSTVQASPVPCRASQSSCASFHVARPFSSANCSFVLTSAACSSPQMGPACSLAWMGGVPAPRAAAARSSASLTVHGALDRSKATISTRSFSSSVAVTVYQMCVGARFAFAPSAWASLLLPCIQRLALGGTPAAVFRAPTKTASCSLLQRPHTTKFWCLPCLSAPLALRSFMSFAKSHRTFAAGGSGASFCALLSAPLPARAACGGPCG